MRSRRTKPNTGVAQGSMISPALFDVYVGSMWKAGWRRLEPKRHSHLSKNFIKYNNLQYKEYKLCKNKTRNSMSHLRFVHDICLIGSVELIGRLKETVPSRRKKVTRNQAQGKRRCYRSYFIMNDET